MNAYLGDQSPVVQALSALTATSSHWRLAQSSSADMHIYIRSYPDSTVDTMAVLAEHDARGHRTNPRGRTVRRHEGALAEVANALAGYPRLTRQPDRPWPDQSPWTRPG